MHFAGVIFDLDGTLIDSHLDFPAIRRDMGLPEGRPILEALAELPEGDRKRRCLEVLHEHERRGAELATLMPGAGELLSHLTSIGIPQAIFTRNSRDSTELALARLGIAVSIVLTRDDAPPKPDPTGVLKICELWGMPAERVVLIGDYRFDIEAGRQAGATTVLYAPNGRPPYADEADHVISHFSEAFALFA